MAAQKRILYAVLNWGLGHATRSIPVIDFLLEKKYFVVIASDGDALFFLQNHYARQPQLVFESLPPYSPVYHAADGSFTMKIATQLPKFFSAIAKENIVVKSLCQKWQIATVISDNRYGCYVADLPSYIITHQLNVRLPLLLKPSFDFLLSYQLSKFSAVLIPDFPDRRLSGSLSDTKAENVYFLGALSRLKKTTTPLKYKILCLLSGPEPQRSILEEKLKNSIDFSGENILLRGTNIPDLHPVKNSINMADTQQLNDIVNAAEIIVCRSGYTTLMDLAKIQHRKIICIPTPGQTEQEYLAEKLSAENKVVYLRQCYTDWQNALQMVQQTSGFDEEWEDTVFYDTMKKIGLC